MLDDPDPDFMTTESLRRFELTFRTQNKRYARLTMQVWFYNWSRVNSAVNGTPAQASGLTAYRFSLKDMLHMEMWAKRDVTGGELNGSSATRIRVTPIFRPLKTRMDV